MKTAPLKTLFLLSTCFISGVSCMTKSSQSSTPTTAVAPTILPPTAAQKPHQMEKHGDVRNDPYFWLKNREDSEVINHLKKENDYAKSMLADTKSLQETLFKEMRGRIKEDDTSVPIKKGDYFYQNKTETGKQYAIYIRRHLSLDAPEEVLIDGNKDASGKSFYSSTGPIMSTSHQLMAYGTDTVGRRFYDFEFKDLKTGKKLPHRILQVTSNLVWANDNETVFYTKQDPKTLRSNQIYRFNTKTGKVDLVFEENDETFYAGLSKGLTDKFIYIYSGSTLSTEVRFLDADKPLSDFKILQKREHDHEYSVSESETEFFIRTNWKGKNFRLMKTSFAKTEKENWKEVIPHRADVYLQDADVYEKFIATNEKVKGLNQLFLYDRKNMQKTQIPFSDQSYAAGFGGNAEFKTDIIRYDYSSMRQPPSVFDYNYVTKQTTLRKQREVPGFNPDLYKVERVFIPARDGKKVPISILMKKDFVADGSRPLLIYGYGSYGANLDAGFSSNVYSLVDRGFVFVRAHIRGGSDLGREWYDLGRTNHKMNTFYDFIDATEWLIKQKYTSPQKVFAMGGSAGGLLMGAISNLRPDLYRGIVAQVPFVDVLTTMLDDSIPLTTGEYDEWGNPNVKKDYNYIKQYSPYDQVKAQAYPDFFVSTGLHDSQVQYWEPAKWVLKLRDMKTNNAEILFRINMDAGHGGASGRFDILKEIAEEYAFILSRK